MKLMRISSPRSTKTVFAFSAANLVGLLALSLILFVSIGTASPTAGPTLIDKGPAPNDPAVEPSALITATFDIDPDAGTVTDQTFAVHSRFYGLITGTLSTVGNEITVDPDQEFLPGDRVQVIATSGIDDGGVVVAPPRSSETDDSTRAPLEALENPQQWGFGISRVADRCFGTFTDSGTADDALTGVYQGSARWFDADGDGDLDMALTGQTGGGLATQIALNDGSGAFTDGGAIDDALITVQDGTLAVADYNNDGRPDLIMTGLADGFTPSVQIGRNAAGTMVDSGADDANLPSLYESAAEWGDYDNDGDLDLFISGMGSTGAVTKVFQNNAGTLEDSGTFDDALPQLRKSAAAWGDYDNDGDLDLVVSGSSTSGWVTTLYENLEGELVDSGAADAVMSGVQDGALDWGDIDGDGDLDLALSGFSSTGPITHIYRNDLGTFVNNADVITGVHQGDLAFGDYNNDGLADLVVVGLSLTGQTAELYKNTGSGLTRDLEADASLVGVSLGSVTWGDYDADGDADLLITGFSPTGAVTKLFTNDSCSLTIDAPTDLVEDDTGTTAFNFTVTRWGDINKTVTFDYAVSSATADAADFGGTLPSGTVSVLAGSRDTTVTINSTGDSTYEADETFTVTLSNPTVEATIATAAADATIQNDDSLISIIADDADKLEGDSGDNSFTFTITRTGYVNKAVTVAYSVTGDANATDFKNGTLPSGNHLLPLGVISNTLTVIVNGDNDVEPNEAFTVTLSSPMAGGDLGTTSAAGTIQNDDGDIDLIAVTAVQDEGDSGNTAFTYVISRTGSLGTAFTVDYAVSGYGLNPADADDFGGTFNSGTISFLTTDTSKTITINASGDTDFEPDEGFRVDLSNATNSIQIGVMTLAGTIENDDTGLSIVAANSVDAEGMPLTFTVNRTGNLSGAHAVDYVVSAGATNPADGLDFGGSFPTGTLNFSAAEASKTITLTVLADATVEANETFSVTLTNPTNNANILTSAASGTIENDDGAIAVGPDGLSQIEGDSGTITFTYGITLSAPAVAPISVDYGVIGNGANPANSSDFAGGYPSGTLNFGIGEDTAQVEVAVNGDTATEEDETFAITFSNATGGFTLDSNSLTGTIENDDRSIAISGDSAIQEEGQDGETTDFTFLVTRIGNPVGAITADYQVVLNNTSADDFEASVVPSGTISLADGELSATITVTVRGDNLVEPSETFDVELSNPTGASVQTSRATGIIQNDDNGYSIAAVTASQPEGNSDVTEFSFTVIRQGTSTTNSSINYAVSGFGTHPADATDFGGFLDATTLLFQSGKTDQEITISLFVVGDTDIENDETFVVTLSNPTGNEEISTATAFATIENDDEGLLISALPGDQAQAEGDSGTTPFNYTLDLVGTFTQPVTVDYAVTGPAANGTDFTGGTLPAGTVSFAPGTTSQTLAIPVNGDETAEQDESFTITLSNVTSGISLGESTITGTIENDDGNSIPTTIFLPVMMTLPPATADLVVDSITITDGAPTIVIRNAGGLAVTDDFWVDLYVNPDTPPAAVNDTIETLQSDGMVWAIEASATPIGPDATVTLTLASSSFNMGTLDAIPAGATVYVHVDSANLSTNYGGVLEGHEINNQPYNNISKLAD